MKVYVNQIEIPFNFEIAPTRIISLVPSQTELLFDLGLEQSLVGLTKFCVHPSHLKSKIKIVGGTKTADFDKIRLLKPDIIVANKEENTKDLIFKLSLICPVIVTDIKSIDDNLDMILKFGEIFKKNTEAQVWYDKIIAAYNDFQSFIRTKPIKSVAYFIWKNPYMVAGSDTFINELLRINNLKNYYSDNTRYPEVELKEISDNIAPELVLLSSEPYPFKKKDFLEFEVAFPQSKILLADGECFSWYGTRILFAFEYFKKLHSQI